jgi:hypothetical protein
MKKANPSLTRKAVKRGYAETASPVQGGEIEPMEIVTPAIPETHSLSVTRDVILNGRFHWPAKRPICLTKEEGRPVRKLHFAKGPAPQTSELDLLNCSPDRIESMTTDDWKRFGRVAEVSLPRLIVWPDVCSMEGLKCVKIEVLACEHVNLLGLPADSTINLKIGALGSIKGVTFYCWKGMQKTLEADTERFEDVVNIVTVCEQTGTISEGFDISRFLAAPSKHIRGKRLVNAEYDFIGEARNQLRNATEINNEAAAFTVLDRFMAIARKPRYLLQLLRYQGELGGISSVIGKANTLQMDDLLYCLSKMTLDATFISQLDVLELRVLEDMWFEKPICRAKKGKQKREISRIRFEACIELSRSAGGNCRSRILKRIAQDLAGLVSDDGLILTQSSREYLSQFYIPEAPLTALPKSLQNSESSKRNFENACLLMPRVAEVLAMKMVPRMVKQVIIDAYRTDTRCLDLRCLTASEIHSLPEDVWDALRLDVLKQGKAIERIMFPKFMVALPVAFHRYNCLSQMEFEQFRGPSLDLQTLQRNLNPRQELYLILANHTGPNPKIAALPNCVLQVSINARALTRGSSRNSLAAGLYAADELRKKSPHSPLLGDGDSPTSSPRIKRKRVKTNPNLSRMFGGEQMLNLPRPSAPARKGFDQLHQELWHSIRSGSRQSQQKLLNLAVDGSWAPSSMLALLQPPKDMEAGAHDWVLTFLVDDADEKLLLDKLSHADFLCQLTIDELARFRDLLINTHWYIEIRPSRLHERRDNLILLALNPLLLLQSDDDAPRWIELVEKKLSKLVRPSLDIFHPERQSELFASAHGVLSLDFMKQLRTKLLLLGCNDSLPKLGQLMNSVLQRAYLSPRKLSLGLIPAKMLSDDAKDALRAALKPLNIPILYQRLLLGSRLPTELCLVHLSEEVLHEISVKTWKALNRYGHKARRKQSVIKKIYLPPGLKAFPNKLTRGIKSATQVVCHGYGGGPISFAELFGNQLSVKDHLNDYEFDVGWGEGGAPDDLVIDFALRQQSAVYVIKNGKRFLQTGGRHTKPSNYTSQYEGEELQQLLDRLKYTDWEKETSDPIHDVAARAEKYGVFETISRLNSEDTVSEEVLAMVDQCYARESDFFGQVLKLNGSMSKMPTDFLSESFIRFSSSYFRWLARRTASRTNVAEPRWAMPRFLTIYCRFMEVIDGKFIPRALRSLSLHGRHLPPADQMEFARASHVLEILWPARRFSDGKVTSLLCAVPQLASLKLIQQNERRSLAWWPETALAESASFLPHMTGIGGNMPVDGVDPQVREVVLPGGLTEWPSHLLTWMPRLCVVAAPSFQGSTINLEGSERTIVTLILDHCDSQHGIFKSAQLPQIQSTGLTVVRVIQGGALSVLLPDLAAAPLKDDAGVARRGEVSNVLKNCEAYEWSRILARLFYRKQGAVPLLSQILKECRNADDLPTVEVLEVLGALHLSWKSVRADLTYTEMVDYALLAALLAVHDDIVHTLRLPQRAVYIAYRNMVNELTAKIMESGQSGWLNIPLACYIGRGGLSFIELMSQMELIGEYSKEDFEVQLTGRFQPVPNFRVNSRAFGSRTQLLTDFLLTRKADQDMDPEAYLRVLNGDQLSLIGWTTKQILQLSPAAWLKWKLQAEVNEDVIRCVIFPAGMEGWPRCLKVFDKLEIIEAKDYKGEAIGLGSLGDKDFLHLGLGEADFALASISARRGRVLEVERKGRCGLLRKATPSTNKRRLLIGERIASENASVLTDLLSDAGVAMPSSRIDFIELFGPCASSEAISSFEKEIKSKPKKSLISQLIDVKAMHALADVLKIASEGEAEQVHTLGSAVQLTYFLLESNWGEQSDLRIPSLFLHCCSESGLIAALGQVRLRQWGSDVLEKAQAVLSMKPELVQTPVWKKAVRKLMGLKTTDFKDLLVPRQRQVGNIVGQIMMLTPSSTVQSPGGSLPAAERVVPVPYRSSIPSSAFGGRQPIPAWDQEAGVASSLALVQAMTKLALHSRASEASGPRPTSLIPTQGGSDPASWFSERKVSFNEPPMRSVQFIAPAAHEPQASVPGSAPSHISGTPLVQIVEDQSETDKHDSGPMDLT